VQVFSSDNLLSSTFAAESGINIFPTPICIFNGTGFNNRTHILRILSLDSYSSRLSHFSKTA
jgi:hypothetical protein